MQLGNSKKRVLATTVRHFFAVWERIPKEVAEKQSVVDELKEFNLDRRSSLALKRMTDIYESKISSGAAGVATGAAVTLALGGGSLSGAGAAVASGLGVTGVLGSALSTVTPLAVIAAPVMFFTAYSANKKADENLAEAKKIHAQAEAAVEKMKISTVLCQTITAKADMMERLLNDLNSLLSDSVNLLDSVTEKQVGFFSSKISKSSITEDEKALIAVTYSLMVATRAVIDVPLMDNNNVSSRIDSFCSQQRSLVAVNSNELQRLKQIPLAKFSSSPQTSLSFGKNDSLKRGAVLVILLVLAATVVYVNLYPGQALTFTEVKNICQISDTLIYGTLSFLVAAFLCLHFFSAKVPTYAEVKDTCQVGDIFTYGSYPQGKNGEVKPIEWQVLARESDRVLVIAKYGLDAQPYDEEWEDTNWSQCTLRSWLNGEFMEKAFTDEERGNLLEAILRNPNSPKDWNNVPGGPDTRDKVFLLSMDEVERYFGSEAERRCKCTAYAQEHGAYVRGHRCWWWLRSPGYFANYAAVVFSDGSFYVIYGSVNDDRGAVRPAAFLSL